jgi:hypothetical protein
MRSAAKLERGGLQRRTGMIALNLGKLGTISDGLIGRAMWQPAYQTDMADLVQRC